MWKVECEAEKYSYAVTIDKTDWYRSVSSVYET